jgi:hypothetical protein
LLREILDELRRLRQALRPRQLSHSDHLVLDRLLPAVWARWSDAAFTVADLNQDAVFAELIKPLHPKQVGQLLSRAMTANADIAGYRVDKVANEHHATLWQVIR